MRAFLVCLLALSATSSSADPVNTEIAYVRSMRGSSTGHLYAIARNGLGPRPVFARDALVSTPSWSPDGRTLAVVVGRADGGSAVALVQADGSGFVELDNGLFISVQPTWSPDGQRLVFSGAARGSCCQLYSMALDGSDVRMILGGTGLKLHPAISPDGTRIAFATHNGATGFDIISVNIDGTERTELVKTPFHDLSPAWSTDGAMVVFERIDFTQPPDARSLYAQQVGGGEPRLLATGTGRVTFSPDGARIAFTGFGAGGTLDVYTVALDGSNRVNITQDPEGDEHSPTWALTAAGSAAE